MEFTLESLSIADYRPCNRFSVKLAHDEQIINPAIMQRDFVSFDVFRGIAKKQTIATDIAHVNPDTFKRACLRYWYGIQLRRVKDVDSALDAVSDTIATIAGDPRYVNACNNYAALLNNVTIAHDLLDACITSLDMPCPNNDLIRLYVAPFGGENATLATTDMQDLVKALKGTEHVLNGETACHGLNNVRACMDKVTTALWQEDPTCGIEKYVYRSNAGMTNDLYRLYMTRETATKRKFKQENAVTRDVISIMFNRLYSLKHDKK